MLTLGAAGATLLVMLAVLGIPALDACGSDDRGLLGCLRDTVNDRFDLGARPVPPEVARPAAITTSTVTDPPVVHAQPPVAAEPVTEPAPQSLVADAPAIRVTPEPKHSPTPPITDKPATPAVAPPQAVVTPSVDIPSEAAPAETAADEPVDAAPARETVALADQVESEAPAFIVPPSTWVGDDVPPDLQVAIISPDVVPPAEAKPDFVLPATPDLPTSPPPDLMETAEIGNAPEPSAPTTPEAPVLPPSVDAPAPGFVLSETPVLPTAPPPDLSVAAVDPVVGGDPVAPPIDLAEPTDAPKLPVAKGLPEVPPPVAEAPGFVLPAAPALPTTPPPDLRIAAIDPVVPDAQVAPDVPVLAPTIDAVEIDGDGNFIAGSGPAGATMRLYVDGIPAGVSSVEGGRWLVEATGLLTEPKQTLKVEALDPLSGKVIGEAIVAFERPVEPVAETPAVEEPAATDTHAALELPTPSIDAPAAVPQVAVDAPMPDAPIEQATTPLPAIEQPATDPVTQVAIETPEASPPPADIAIDAPAVTATLGITELPAADASRPGPVPDAQLVLTDAIPEITPVTPVGESASVTILKPPAEPSITMLPTGKTSSDAVVTLGAAPKSPALIAQFSLPTGEVAPDVTVLRAVPFGDPGAGRFVSGKAIIRHGDTLWDISHRYYGRGIRYRTILRANSELIARPGKIYPGQVFDLPLVYDD